MNLPQSIFYQPMYHTFYVVVPGPSSFQCSAVWVVVEKERKKRRKNSSTTCAGRKKALEGAPSRASAASAARRRAGTSPRGAPASPNPGERCSDSPLQTPAASAGGANPTGNYVCELRKAHTAVRRRLDVVGTVDANPPHAWRVLGEVAPVEARAGAKVED